MRSTSLHFLSRVICSIAFSCCVCDASDDDVDFNRDIRPILSKNCFACHGPDDEARQAELRLDTAEGALSERVVQPGNADSSELISRIESTDPDKVMPPPDSGHQLTDRQLRRLRAWVAGGADYTVHWSFAAPKKSSLPPLVDNDWPKHPIDHFVLAKLEKAGLAPEAEADRYRWIRRVSLDLTGIPPTVAEADAFAADDSEQAFEIVVDRLLQSDEYGEHWTRMWLDLARYADTRGYEKDRPREIWRYRDWVIDAFNRDLPFDQFTIEQLAGDLLPAATPDQVLATAFHRNTLTNEEGGTDNEEFRIAAVKDRVDTTMQVWMGLTMGCAKCHSHKYDPVTQDHYYSLFAIFNQTEDADRGDDAPVLASPTKQQEAEIAGLQVEKHQLVLQLSEEQKGLDPTVDQEIAPVTTPRHDRLAKINATLADLDSAVARIPVMRELPEDERRGTHIHVRGNFLNQGAMVQPGLPELFGTLPESDQVNRLSVAEWIVQPENPLTARVIVNRIWARLFGIGIVETEEDFGSQGSGPTHPELLDWLAVDFREQGWSFKRLMRSLVLSSTYRQSSHASTKKLTLDPQNRLLSRGPGFRLSAEAIRDQSLAASGLLTQKTGGPSVMPPQPAGVWKSTYSALQWEDAIGPNRFRRALYTYWKRTSPHPAMTTFDAGSAEVCQIRRVRTNTPLQALVTLNDPAYVEAAGALAQIAGEAGRDVSDQISHAFRRVLIRPPTPTETTRLAALYESLQVDFQTNSAAANEWLHSAGLNEGDAAMVGVANVLLNLDETLMKP
ncbi:MAG: PSD1 and planctomycete cytochrome C domain-containing protein [Planctomycetaceae bacterium]